jgi:hypothetical protein
MVNSKEILKSVTNLIIWEIYLPGSNAV